MTTPADDIKAVIRARFDLEYAARHKTCAQLPAELGWRVAVVVELDDDPVPIVALQPVDAWVVRIVRGGDYISGGEYAELRAVTGGVVHPNPVALIPPDMTDERASELLMAAGYLRRDT